jgi:hypothetical protein
MLLVLGCTASDGTPSKSTDQSKETDKNKEPVRLAFTAFQAAVKARDSEKLWNSLDSDSRTDADRAAKTIRTAYEKASADDKAKLEMELGLSSADLVMLTGAGFLKSDRFHGKYHEVADSKIDDITVQGDKATVAYTEEDGDKEKLVLHRQDGQWKVSVAMPK